MAIFVISIIIIILFALAAHLFFRNRITFNESILQCSIASVLSLMILFGIYHNDMGDVAIINGQVTDKQRVKVSCGHSYKCMCYTTCTTTGKTQSCTEHCSTCYEHSYDVDWRVYTTVGDLEISRINRQGTHQPPRWTAVKIGEPASNTVSYINYVKAAPDSLFALNKSEKDVTRFVNLIPSYPKIYDYYRVNRVLQMGVNYPYATQLNDYFNNSLKTLGAQKQVNIIVIFVKTNDAQYRYALERAWIGGKKNDVIILMGMSDATTLSWTDTITFGKNAGNEMLSVLLRDRISLLSRNQQFTNPQLLSDVIIKTISTDFKRKEMKDFEYLKEDYSPSQTAIMWYIIIQMLVLTITTVFFYHFELERGDWASNNKIKNVFRISRRNPTNF